MAGVRLVLILVAFLCPFAHSAAQSGNHGDGHAEGHDIYKDWRIPPTGNSCCNNGDCRPTRAYIDEQAGVWRAWNGQRWLFIPPGLVLPTDLAGDGRSHLCEKDGQVYCFTPGQIRG